MSARARCVLLVSWLGLARSAAAQEPAAPSGIESSTAAEIAAHIGVLAHDSLMGRATPSPGLSSAARYVARELERGGLRPLDGSSLLLHFPLVTTHRIESAIRLQPSRGGGAALSFGTDFAVMPAGAVRTSGTIVRVPDLSDSAALHGRIPMVTLPPGDWSDAAHAATFAARRAGAKGLVLVLDSTQAVAPVAKAGAVMDHSSNGVPTALVTPAAARRLGGGRITLTIPVRADTTDAPYVLGLLPGSDPQLRREYVVLSAHLDHLGIGTPDERGDSIYNGADDNASGVAAVLVAAKVLGTARPAPRRSILFLATSGEEVGIRGSEYFTGHPPVPLEAIVADVNLDGIGRSWQADTISAEGGPFSSLGRTVRRVATAHPELRLTIVDDQWPDRHYFDSSDQIWFARRGVPSVFLSSTGPDAHYHKPSDEVSTIEPELTARIARLAAWLARDVADAAGRPQWDETARRRIQVR
jgi:hypothetical protein